MPTSTPWDVKRLYGVTKLVSCWQTDPSRSSLQSECFDRRSRTRSWKTDRPPQVSRTGRRRWPLPHMITVVRGVQGRSCSCSYLILDIAIQYIVCVQLHYKTNNVTSFLSVEFHLALFPRTGGIITSSIIKKRHNVLLRFTCACSWTLMLTLKINIPSLISICLKRG